MTIDVNPNNYIPKFPLTLSVDGVTNSYADFGHLEGNLEEFMVESDKYKLTDANMMELVLTIDSLNIVLLRPISGSAPVYHSLLSKQGTVVATTETIDEIVTRVVTIEGKKMKAFPSQWNKSLKINIDFDQKETIKYFEFQNLWSLAKKPWEYSIN